MAFTSSLRRSVGISMTAVLVAAVSGCAVLAPKTPEQQVSARAIEFWTARQVGNFDKAYAYGTPGFRKLKTAQEYKRLFGGGVVGVERVEVNKVVCEPQRCEVQMKLSVTPALVGIKLGAIDTYLNEVWLLEEGQWWRFQDL